MERKKLDVKQKFFFKEWEYLFSYVLLNLSVHALLDLLFLFIYRFI